MAREGSGPRRDGLHANPGSAGAGRRSCAFDPALRENFPVLIIFGFRTRPSTVSEGNFYCPRCGADRHYALQRFRKWFTLFFLPVFPIGKAVGEQVKCQTCGTAFRPEVLHAPTSASLSDNLRDTMRVAAVAMLSAGNPEHLAARQAAVAAIASSGAAGYGDADLSEDLLNHDPSHLAGPVSQLAPGLNDQGKELFLSRLAAIAVADGPLDEGERAVLEAVGAGLGLSAAHVLGIVTSVVNSPRP
jgi:rubredoxin